MGPYKSQIPAEDRWAIVAYVKALQETGITPPGAGAAESEEAETPGAPSLENGDSAMLQRKP